MKSRLLRSLLFVAVSNLLSVSSSVTALIPIGM